MDQDNTLDFESLIDSVPNRIQLTPQLEEALEKERGVTAPTHFECRRTARFRCHGSAFARLIPFLVELSDFDIESFVIVRDLSKTGVGIISHQQLYPEQVVILTLERTQLETKVVRARKLGPKCFEVGLTILGRNEA